MMKKLLLLILPITVSLLIGCSKSNNSITVPSNMSGLLTKITHINSGSYNTNLFTYDNSQRLISSKQYTVDTFNGNIIYDTAIGNYGYTGNSKLASYLVSNGTGSGTIIDSFYYDSQNRLIKDTSYQTTSNGYNNSCVYYNYFGNWVIVTYTNNSIVIKPTMNQSTFGEVDSLYLTNGNILYESQTNYFYQNGKKINNGIIDITNSYTSYLSPIIGINPTNSPYYSKYLASSTISTSYGYSNSGTNTTNYSYTLNTNGSVSRIISTETGVNGNFIHTANYYY